MREVDSRQKRINKIRAELSKERPEIIAKSNGCELCGCKNCSLILHHIIPVSKGGDNSPENIVVLCEECHKDFHRLYATWEQNFNNDWKKHYSMMERHGIGIMVMYDIALPYLELLRGKSPFKRFEPMSKISGATMKTLDERISDLEREVQSLRKRVNDLEKNMSSKFSEDHVRKVIEESLRSGANRPVSVLKDTQIFAQCLKASEKTDP